MNAYTKLKYLFIVVPQLACCCRAQFTMSDDELSTERQMSDASEPEPIIINCRFTNALTGGTYFTMPLEVDDSVSVGFIINIVKSELGDCTFDLKVGRRVWQNDGLDVCERFWKSDAVRDALEDSEACEVIVEVIKLTRRDDEPPLLIVQ